MPHVPVSVPTVRGSGALLAVVVLTLPLALLSSAAPGHAAAAGDGTIAYVSDATGNDEIMIMTLDGAQSRQLTDSPGPDRAPAFSPDGSHVVFNSRREPHSDRPQLYTIERASGQTTRLTSSPVDDQRPAWSIDGASVYFQRGAFLVAPYNLVRLDLATTTETVLTDSVAAHIWNAAPAPSPDGSIVLFQSNRDAPGTDLFPQRLYALTTATGIVTGVPLGGDLSATASIDGPTWNADGTAVAFSSGGQLFIVDATGDPATWVAEALTDGSGDDSSPDFSPDGTRIVFQSWVAGADPDGDDDIAVIRVIDLATGEQSTIAEGRTPVWTAAAWFAAPSEAPQLAATGSASDVASRLAVPLSLAAVGALAIALSRRIPERTSGLAPHRRSRPGRR